MCLFIYLGLTSLGRIDFLLQLVGFNNIKYTWEKVDISFFVCVKVTDCSKLGRVDRHDSVLTRGKLELLTNISILLLTCRDHCTMNSSIMVVIHKVCLFEKLARGK